MAVTIGRSGLFPLIVVVISTLAGCAEYQTADGPERRFTSAGIAPPAAAAPSGGPRIDLAQPILDQAGRSWQARVLNQYQAASGRACATVQLIPLGGTSAQPITRIACDRGTVWTLERPLIEDKRQGEPSFAPIAATAASQPAQSIF